MSIPDVPVVIVGAGPTGLTTAILLSQYGIDCVVLERWKTVYPRPRAVHLDGETRRTIARLGIDDQFAAISRPALGLRLLDRNLLVLAQFDRDPTGGRSGYPEANLFDQPVLECILWATALQQPGITIRGDVDVTAVTAEGDGVRVDLTDRTSAVSESMTARFVLGCDGANSVVRADIGSVMKDLGFEQTWLVIDIATDADLGEWEGVHQICDPFRAATFMRIGATRYRWEFRMRPGESADDYADMAAIHPLIVPWTGRIPIEKLELIRAAEYTSRACIADRWRNDRVFLLGDAAHLTPPFIGQGLGAGLRDAANLSWKLAGVLAGALPASVLDTYEAERKPHARSLIRLAKFTGTAMTDGGELGNLLRRLIAPHLHRIPGFDQLVTGGQTPRLHRSELVAPARLGKSLNGSLIPNARIETNHRFDALADGRYAIVTVSEPNPAEVAAIERLGGVAVIARPAGELWAWLRSGHTYAALIRPDGIVQQTGRRVSDLLAVLPHFDIRTSPPSANDGDDTDQRSFDAEAC
ncbi:bifunctional 3-(3-hydroxy-phenyl)propionate/3-hydroxycinnamic acid hydroxylase [Nocardia asteroides]|uniref:bifunctional 3-(3-hydroxy-phenyl)propionate/3-hydroxycinnamic acid hydroxylase MhpA n=1 Tax=Nocardia asteroides TaxID=1824 RepID=UPI0033F457D6